MPLALANGARVLLVRLSALGDVLFALETVTALKRERPDVFVGFLVEDRFAGILKGHPDIDHLHTVPRRNMLVRYPGAVRALRKQRYDVTLDLHGILKSALAVQLANTDLRVGFAPPGTREGAGAVYDHAVPLPDPLPHRADRGYYLLRAFGLKAERTRPRLAEPESPTSFWNSRSPRVVLHPGTSAFAAFKRWPLPHFVELAQRLAADGMDVAISHGPGERDLVDPVLVEAKGTRRLDGTKLGLIGLADVYRQADVVVAADTGPLHIASAAGTRVVALFGPKDTSLYGPRGADDIVLYHDVPCRPCKRRRCAMPLCIRGLDVDRVEGAVRQSLAGAP